MNEVSTDLDNIQLYTDKGNHILSLKKWCNEYRKEYQKLYYKIKIKEDYTQQEIDLYNKMGKKNPQVKKKPYVLKDKAIKIQGLTIIKKSVSITFD